jgi:serine phosphatase RsbU (regulator of sigma subunit)
VPIGLLADVEYGERTLALDAGDRLYLYTDGITEALNEDEEEFGRARLIETLEAGRDLAPGESLQEVVTRVQDWQGNELGMDDLSILVTEIA